MTKEWLKYRTTILGLYKDQSKTLDEVRRIMKDEYGFEASVRAYRSRFDKWRVHKYNCARRRAATVTAAGGYPQQEVYLCGSRDGHVQRQHADCQFLPVARHYSAPDVLVTESDIRRYTPQESYARPGIKSEQHVDNETSPRILAAGGEYPGQSYRPWYESHSEGIGDPTHQAPKAAGVPSSPTRMLLNSGLPVRPDDNLYHTEQLHWIVHAIQLPLQQDALESLLRCLLCGPDVTRALPGGEAPFSRLANMIWQQLASDGDLGPDPVWKLACECLCQLLILGADPDVLVGDRPFLFKILEQPSRTRAFGLLGPFVLRLASVASPVSHHGLNALHALLLLGGSEAADPAPAPIEATARARLAKILIGRVAAAGRLGDRNATGLTALQQYVYHSAARDPPEHVLAICAELVRHEGAAAAAGGGGGGDTETAVIPPSFVGDLRAGKLPPGLHAHDGGGGGVSATAAASFLPFVWTSACQQSLRGDAAAAEEHLGVVLCCVGGRVDAEGLRASLPRPAVVPIALPSPVSPRGEVKYAW